PDKLRLTLETTFAKSFQLVFEKGEKYIEKTYKKDKKILEHDLINYAIDRDFSKKHIKKLDKQSNQSKRINKSVTLFEGGVLGFLGVGLPDIPVFIAMIMRTIYEVALSYGYDYNNDKERSYILLTICGAMSYGEKQKYYNEQIDHLGSLLDKDMEVKVDLKEQMEETSQILADSMLVGKFVQGIPVVGTIGGVINYTIINKIGKFASIKYKKRYLLGKERG
ncbi:MAG: EcsC family protein, partial [Tissierella sp.]|nr:EcsC family protein [Tissierella sp.]